MSKDYAKVVREYEQTLQQLVESPRSPRLFNTVFDRGLDLLRDHGTGFRLWIFGERKGEFKLEGEGLYDHLKLRYRNDLMDDELKVSYVKCGLYKEGSFTLTRKKPTTFYIVQPELFRFAPASIRIFLEMGDEWDLSRRHKTIVEKF